MTKHFITIKLKKLLRYNLETFRPKKIGQKAFNKKNCWEHNRKTQKA